MARVTDEIWQLAHHLHPDEPWECDREMYKRRNEIEQLFRCLKGFHRIFSRFEKLDVFLLGFILFALIVDALH